MGKEQGQASQACAVRKIGPVVNHNTAAVLSPKPSHPSVYIASGGQPEYTVGFFRGCLGALSPYCARQGEVLIRLSPKNAGHIGVFDFSIWLVLVK